MSTVEQQKISIVSFTNIPVAKTNPVSPHPNSPPAEKITDLPFLYDAPQGMTAD